MLTVIHTDDMHAAWNGLPRLAQAATHVRETAAPALFLDAADTGLSPGWKRGDLVLPFLHELRWDAAALSDSEASLSEDPGNLRMMRQIADHALICNVAPLPIGTEPYTFYQFGDLRVAILGLTQARVDERGQRIEDPDIIGVVERAVRALRPEADILIAIGHLGLPVDCRIAERVEGLDLIVGGDSHHRLVRPLRVGTALIGHAADLAMVAGEMTADLSDGKVVSDSRIIDLGRPDFADTFGDEGVWRQRLLGLVGAAEPELTEKLATCGDLWGDSWRENPVANYVTDRLREAFGSELMLIDSHYALPQWQEEVTQWDLEASVDGVYPYFYHLAMTGAQIRQLLEESCFYPTDRERLSADRFAQVESCAQLPGNPYQLSGGRVKIDLNRPPGERVVEIEVGERPVDDDRPYQVSIAEIASIRSSWVRQIYHHERRRFDAITYLREDLQRRGHLEAVMDGRFEVVESA